MGRTIRGVPKHQGMRLQDLLCNGKKRCISSRERPSWSEGNQILESHRKKKRGACVELRDMMD